MRYQGSFKFKEVLTYVVTAKSKDEAEKKLRHMESHFWKLDLETVDDIDQQG